VASWDVLISTIPHRHQKLCLLLAELDRQRQPGFGVRLLRDNLERPMVDSHVKRQELLESSAADYVCSLDDDDWVAPDYVSAIMEALEQEPDYVGFLVNVMRDGKQWRTATHSLEHGRHETVDSLYIRDITHLNPMRREVALLASWRDVIDDDWAAKIRDTGRLRTQVMIDRYLYLYRADTTDCFYTSRGPMPEPLPQLPEYPWLTVIY